LSAFSPLDFFFICLSLFTGKLPCTDDADSLATVGVRYHEQATSTRESEGDEPIFLLGMIRIEDSYAFRPFKTNPPLIVDVDAVLALAIPL
jgi:hypothetical protein